MKNSKPHTGKFTEWLLRMLFVALPAFLMSAYVLQNINLAYTGFESGTGGQFIAVASGIVISCTLAMFGARFIVFSLGVVLLMYIGSVISSNAGGEFDQFYLSARYSLYSTLFVAGWLTGFLISRTRWYVVFYCVLLTIAFVFFFAKRENMDAGDLSLNLLPVFLYSMFMLFFVPGMLSPENVSLRKTGGWMMRLLLVCTMFTFAFLIAKRQFKHENEIAEKIIAQKKQKGDKGDSGNGGGGDLGEEYNESNGMLERGGKPDEGKDGDKENDGKGDKQQGKGGKGNADGNDGEGGFRLKDEMKMGEQQSQSDVLMFCARLDNYFPDGSAQPYYFVYHYLPKYDPLTETFVRDPLLKFNDEMRADPSKIGMYKTSRDSSLLRPLKKLKERKVVEADVFISANVWKHSLLAPATPFSIQTIPVDTAYKGLFRSGYHVKSNVSELNNAYFVYNPSANPQLLAYQEERFEELRSIKDYSGMDSTWFSYYTDLPAGSLFDSIRNLTLAVTAGASTPADKVAAIRDYFLQIGPKGTRLYRYTLDPGAPGDPNIPTGNMLRNFLFRSHEGYCTYFAGASVLMLRSIGIPARFTTGFATVDRSDKNKGWYWFYASQAHAWTQVYFPEYGWMDFDMTIGNEERNNAPKPDGTPPVPPPQPWLIVEGIVNEEPDAASKSLSVRFSKIVFFNDEYQLKEEQNRDVNASLCRIVYGKKDTTFNAIHEGDTVFIVSWDDLAKDVPEPDPDLAIEVQVNRFEWPLIADEIYIMKKKTEVQPERKNDKVAQNAKTEINWKGLLEIVLYSALCLMALIFLFPFLWFVVLLNRARRTADFRYFAEANYRLSLFLFHLSGTEIKAETSLSFAQRADAAYGTSFSAFVQGYIKLKYSNLILSPQETDGMKNYTSVFRSELRKALSVKSVIVRWLNIARAVRYFRTPEPFHQTENVNQSTD
jgi:protein-glutamine gamma-glutamyltransferase